MVKVFDLEPGGLKDGGQAKLNEEESAKFNKEQELKKKHEETNKGLGIELRNKISAPIMRVEFPNEILEEIKDGIGNPTDEFRNNLENIFKQIAKTFLKKTYTLEKQLKIDFRLYQNNSNDIYEHKLKALFFTDGGGLFNLKWADDIKDHQLRPSNNEDVTTEPGVLIIYPSYVKFNKTPTDDYLEKSPVIEIGVDYE
tara:strand:- start:44499 stop:45092 length:594 start_codon:yes stop_codon:yes gene_type:complete